MGCVCVCAPPAHVEVTGQPVEVSSFSPCGTLRLSSDHQVWPQVSLPAGASAGPWMFL